MGFFPSSIPQDTHEDAAAYWIGRLLTYQPSLLPYLRDLLDVVTAYIPHVVAAPILTSPPTGPIGFSLSGTVMFADIDGFTPLAERFSQIALEKGAEELTELVNRFLEILIRVTSRYGGDLQKFGGDAGMLFFQGDGHALRAVAAALEVQEAVQEMLGNVETSLGCFPLRISIGLGSGAMVGLGLGNTHGREWLLLGSPLDTMGRAQCAAPPDETLIASETLDACAGNVVCVPAGEGLHRVVSLRNPPAPASFLPLPNRPDLENADCVTWFLSRLDALVPYLAPGLLERLVTAPSFDRTRLWSEFRQVTVMMLSLPSFAEVPSCLESQEKLQQALVKQNDVFMAIRDTILRYDGIVNKLGISPQGPYGMVLFGAPRAYEDDPLRAVLAALELQETFDFSLRFGINTGYVFAGDMGTSVRREYTVMGDEVNLAYRLMSGCNCGEIWLGPDTHQHSSVKYRVVGEMGEAKHFKGKADPIAPFVVKGLHRTHWETATTETSIVGRDEELLALSRTLREVARGHVCVSLVHGEAGVGKSRLMQEVAKLAEGMGFAVRTGYTPSYGAHLPLAAWEGLLLSLFELEDIPLEERPAALSVALARYELGPWTSLIAPLVGVALPPSQDLLSLPVDQREAKRQEVLQELWGKAALQEPQLLIFENAHWMSPSSLALLDVLLQMGGAFPLMVLITYRDETSVEGRWENLPNVVDLPLDPFPSSTMRILVQHLFHERPLPAEVRDWVVLRSRGLPLFATEAVRTLIDSGILHRHEDSWELTGSLTNFPLPDMVYSLIQSRIDQLSPPNRHLLRAASVVGNEMNLSMLVAAYGDESLSAVRRRLPALLPFGLVPREVQGRILSFHQPLVREVAYRGLPQRVKRLIHRRISEYLDYSKEEAMPNWLNLLAYHALEGHLWDKALRANLELGKRALQAYLVSQAAEAFRNVLVAADSGGLDAPGARFEAHHLLGEALILLGEYEEAHLHLDQARRSLPPSPTQLEDWVRLADLEYHQAMLSEAEGHYEQALEVVVRGLSLPGIDKTLEGLRLYLLGADLFRRSRDYQQAQAWAQRGVALSTHFATPEAQQLRSRAMYMLALLSSLQRLQK